MAKLFLVFGTQGAGKSVLLAGIRSARVVNIGDEMLKAYAKKFGIKKRDEIRKMSLASYDVMIKTRNAIFKKIVGMPGIVAVDTHASVKIGDSYEMGLSIEDFGVMSGKVAAIIYVDADTEQVLIRRKREQATRKREKDGAVGVEEHRDINMSIATMCSFYLEAPMYVIQNNDGQLAQARRRVAEIIKKEG